MKKKTFILVMLLVFSFCGLKAYSKEREFVIKKEIELYNLEEGKNDIKVWIPYPAQTPWQSVEGFTVNSPFNSRFIQEKKHANKILYLYLKNFDQKTAKIKVYFKVKRREYDSLDDPDKDREDLLFFQRPSNSVAVNKNTLKLANSITQDKESIRAKVNAIYDYLIAEFDYTQDDPKICGRGNSLLTLRHKKGICTDYHSVFLSLVRSLKIPAKFEIGYLLGSEPEGKIMGYHCWAKYYEKDYGWFSVDVSEADKHPEKKDYLFGHLDEDRVLFVTGRDIKLPYAKDRDSMPLNFFIYPYAEVNGEQFFNIKWEVSYKQIKSLKIDK